MKRPLMWLCFLGMLIMIVLRTFWHRLNPPPDLDGEVRIEGRIRKKEYRNNRFILYLKEVSYSFESGDSAENLNTQNKQKIKGLVCYLDEGLVSDASFSDVKIGSRVVLSGKIERIRPATNPGEFDAEKYYGARGYYYTLWNANIISTKGGNAILEWLYNLRRKCAEVLVSKFGEDDGGVLSAMLLGEKEYLLLETKELYSLSGISHILAISGLHISLIGAFLYALLTYFPVPSKTAFFLTVLLLVLYGFMAGFAPSVFRAVFMFSWRLLAKNCRKSYDPPTALALSAFLTCLFFPRLCLDSSFLLSYLAVAGILFLFPCFLPALPGKRRVWDAFPAGLSVFFSTLPVVIPGYHRVSFAGLVFNFFVLPAMPVLFISSFLVLVTNAVCPFLSPLFILVVKSIMYAIRRLCETGQKIPFLTIYPKTPGWGKIVIYTILVVLIGALVRIIKRRLKIRYYELMNLLAAKKETKEKAVYIELKGFRIAERGIFVSLFLFLGLISLILFTTPKKFGLTFLDVGQGDGVFLRTESGSVVMIDGGSSSKSKVGEKIIIPYLSYEGEREVDLWILTHRDKDHVNGFEEVLASDEIRIKRIGIPKCRKEEFEEVINIALMKNTEVLLLDAGQEIVFSENEKIVVASPGVKEDNRMAYEDSNDASLALLYFNEDLAAAFMGDSGIRAEEAMKPLVKKYCSGGERSLILKCSHHGSANGSNTEDYILTIRPEYAVISCGKDNSYGHPHEETLLFLNEAGAIIRRTDKEGAILW